MYCLIYITTKYFIYHMHSIHHNKPKKEKLEVESCRLAFIGHGFEFIEISLICNLQYGKDKTF